MEWGRLSSDFVWYLACELYERCYIQQMFFYSMQISLIQGALVAWTPTQIPLIEVKRKMVLVHTPHNLPCMGKRASILHCSPHNQSILLIARKEPALGNAVGRRRAAAGITSVILLRIIILLLSGVSVNNVDERNLVFVWHRRIFTASGTIFSHDVQTEYILDVRTYQKVCDWTRQPLWM